MERKAAAILKVAGAPALIVSRLISRIYHHDTQKGKLVVGVALALGGAYLAQINHDQTVLPHFIWDAGAYGIHGLGLAPLAERFLALLD